MINTPQIGLKITEKELKILIAGLKAERDKKISMTVGVQDEVGLLDDLRNIYKTHFMPAPKVEVVTPPTYHNPNEMREIT